jgi:alkanesulfonate monooxygenase SsuD/methylene tetrahydromethanopterin reductase-like flavin-dependent oxidoreductase (luciferase family)
MKEQTLEDGLQLGLYGLLRGSGVDPDTLVRRARLAEEAGFESLWIGDHIALPADLDGQQPRLEVVVAVSHLAAVTTRVRLGFGVIVLPQRSRSCWQGSCRRSTSWPRAG